MHSRKRSKFSYLGMQYLFYYTKLPYLYYNPTNSDLSFLQNLSPVITAYVALCISFLQSTNLTSTDDQCVVV